MRCVQGIMTAPIQVGSLQWLTWLIDYRDSAKLPLAASTVLSLIAAVRHEPFGPASAVRLISIVAFYFALGLSAALIRVFWRQWAITRARGAVVGFVAAAAGMCILAMTLAPIRVPPLKLLAGVLIVGIFPGLPLGALAWKPRSQ